MATRFSKPSATVGTRAQAGYATRRGACDISHEESTPIVGRNVDRKMTVVQLRYNR